jgi:transposase
VYDLTEWRKSPDGATTSHMASLTPKVIKGKTYYYARECRRVNGKPKIVRTIYLGSLDNIIAAVEGAREAPRPHCVEIASFGDVVALYDLAQNIGLAEIIDRHVPKRKQGLSPGQYLLLAGINRAVHPTSKAKLADWYQETALPRFVPATRRQLSSQSFWNHMDFFQESHIEAIERELSQRLIDQFGISLRMLTYDGTNFFTYINTKNPAELPQRGHNKQKRGDLRQVNLGMLVSTDFHVPLFHKVYEGNVTDATIFKTITEELRQRYVELAKECEHITLVFDKGNNSKEAFETVYDSRFHFVGSLVPAQHPDLLDVPLQKFRSLDGERLKDCRAYRTRKIVFGQERAIVITYNENLLQGQLQGLSANLNKTRDRLHEIQQVLRRRREGKVKGGKKPTVASVKKQVQNALSRQFMKPLFRWEVGEQAGVPTLTYRTDSAALARLVRRQFGKTILFTDNDDWTKEEIVLAYRAQHHIESAFRDMKNPHYLGWAPMHHWTDSKIRVHAFSCVLGLTLTSLLQRTLHHKGIDVSMSRMYELLGGMRETLVVYPRKPGQHRHRTAASLSALSDDQKTLFDALNLKRYLPA